MLTGRAGYITAATSRCCRTPRTKELGAFVERNVEKGSTLHTDGWGAYKTVAKLGYPHEREGGFAMSPKKNSPAAPSLVGRTLTQTLQNLDRELLLRCARSLKTPQQLRQRLIRSQHTRPRASLTA